MAKGNETTTKFKVDISELKKSMQEARKQVAYANSEFKAVSSSMEDWTKSSDGLSAKLKQLGSNLESQESVLREYEKILEQVKAEYGENSKEALEYATKLNNQQAVVNKIKKEMAGYEDALTEVSKAEKIASKTGQTVADVLEDIGKEADDAGDGFTVLKGAVATFAGNALTSMVSGIKDGIKSIMSLASETREYREDLAKLETAFTTAGLSTDEATKVYKDFYAVLGEEDRSVEAVNHLAKFADTQEDLTKWTNIATGVWATFGDSLPIEGLTEASNETMKTGQLTGVLADALNWAGVSEDSFQASLDSCTTEQERQALITETLNGLYTEASEKYKETNASVMEANRANSDYTDTLAQMGAKIEPVTTALKTGFNELLQELLKLVGDVDMEAFTAKIEEAFGVLKDEVLPAVKTGLGWILDNKDTLIAGLIALAGAFGAFKVVSTINGILQAFNVTLLANPVVLIITAIVGAIAGLVAGFMYLWNNVEGFRNFFINAWEKIKNAVSVAKDWIAEKIEAIGKFFTETIPQFFQSLIDWVKTNWQAILLFLINPFAGLFKYFYDNNKQFKQFVDTAINYIKELPTKVWTWLTNTITKVTTWATDLGNKAKEAGQKLIDGIINKAKEIPDKIKSIGSDIVRGLWNGINDMVGWIGNKIQGFGDSVLTGLKNFFGIHSPSKVMADEVGRWLPEGIAVGITDNAKSTLKAMKDLAVDTVGSARAGLSTATPSTLSGGGAVGGVVNNFTQVINSPKSLSRLDIYRQSKNLLGYAGGGF